jgi:universal stress protein F
MRKPILAALDDSDRSEHVLAAAVSLARTYKVPLILCRVIALPTAAISPDGLPTGVDLQTDLERKARADLDAFLPKVPPDVETRVVTLLDVPWQGICEAAVKEDVGVMVIGSHGYRALDRILGTTAAKVVNHADRAVLVVRGEWLG